MSKSLNSVVTKIIQQLKSIEDQLDELDLASMTADEREHSNGKLREGEAENILALFDAMDEFPETFQSLANKDGGSNPTKLETGPAREALERRNTLAPIATKLQQLQTRVNDDLLTSAEEARELAVPAYKIAKANAPVNDALRKRVASVIDFYGKMVRRRKEQNSSK